MTICKAEVPCMILPLLFGLIPSLVNVAEKLIPGAHSGNDKKEFVQGILRVVYEKFLKGSIPDIDGIDEEEVFVEVCSFLIDLIVKKTLNKDNA